jgi:uncharacterized protein with GYD domain
MPFYLVQLSYTNIAWNTLIKEPQNRLELVRPAIENLGGKVEFAFLSFGEFDVVALFELPNNVDAAVVSMLFMAGGAPRQVKITPLMTWDEGVQAMKKAKKANYTPPKKNPMLDRTSD